MGATKAISAKDMGGNKITNIGAPTAASNDAARKVDVETAYTNAISRANHTGTQIASTISDFDTQVRTSRLDQLAVPTGPLSVNGQRITNQADPTSAQDSATKNYVDTQLAGVVSNQVLKGAVRAYVTSQVTVASPGTTLDGLTAQSGDIFILAAQSTGSENGPWIFTSSATPLVRPVNWDSNAEAVLGSYWIVREGSKADSFALLTNDSTITLGTTALTFTVISVAGSAIGRFAANCPVVSAGATWTVTHSLNSTDVTVQVKRVASPYDYVDVAIQTPDANTVYVLPDVAMASGEYRVIVKY